MLAKISSRKALQGSSRNFNKKGYADTDTCDCGAYTPDFLRNIRNVRVGAAVPTEGAGVSSSLIG
eukprot:7186597-Pyramimonas_sp.AAC.1